VCVLAAALVVIAGFPAVASAGSMSWSAPIGLATPAPTTVNSDHGLSGVACPSAGQCTAVDYVGQQVTFNPAPGTLIPTTVEAGGLSRGVACPSVSQCTAVGGGDEVTFDPAAPGTPTPTTVDSGHYLYGVACPSASQCTAVDRSGRAIEGDLSTPASWNLEPIAGANILYAIACSSVAQCVAVDLVGNGFVGNGLVGSRFVGAGPPPVVGAGPPPASSHTAPVITAFKLTHTGFSVGAKPTAVNAKAKAKPPRGSAFLYTLSKASTATIVIVRQTPGRLVGKKCVAQRKANAKKKRCTITTRAGTLTRNSKAGSNTIAFSGRIGRTALTAATYRATITARVGNGSTSKPRSATFTIVRG
jgi:hypothetical protein